jgi:hypothetical protein
LGLVGRSVLAQADDEFGLDRGEAAGDGAERRRLGARVPDLGLEDAAGQALGAQAFAMLGGTRPTFQPTSSSGHMSMARSWTA